jgi:hypothetical protein
MRPNRDFVIKWCAIASTSLMVATALFWAPAVASVVPRSEPEWGSSSLAIDRFHELYSRRNFQDIYAEYDDEYAAAVSPQRHVEMLRQARKNMGRFISTTSIQSKSAIRHGEQVFIVTELAAFQYGSVHEEFVFKRGSPIGKLLAYKYEL